MIFERTRMSSYIPHILSTSGWLYMCVYVHMYIFIFIFMPLHNSLERNLDLRSSEDLALAWDFQGPR